MSWEDGGPLDPPERGDWESAVERARAAVTGCPECGGVLEDRGSGVGLVCAWAGAAHWYASDEELVEAWAEANEPDPPEDDDGA